MSEGLRKVYCNHCKKKFKTDARRYYNQFEHKLTINCSCPYCDRFGTITNIFFSKNGKQKWMDVFYELKR